MRRLSEVWRSPDLLLAQTLFEKFISSPARSELTYGTRRLAVLPYPLLLNREDVRNLAQHSERVARGIETLTRRRIRENRIDEFGYPPGQTEFIFMDPGYAPNVPIARLDAYVLRGGIKILEVNTDGTAYLDYSQRIGELFLNIFAPLLSRHGIIAKTFDVRQRLRATLLNCYRRFCATRGIRPNPKPHIGILDEEGVKTGREHRNLADEFSRIGTPTVRVDPRDLDAHRSHLSARGTRLDIIYRRATSREIFADESRYRVLLEAYRTGRICIVGSFRSDIGFHKGSLEMMLESIPSRAAKALRPMIPRTIVGRAATGLAGQARRRYLYKPKNLNQGEGIEECGRMSGSEWANCMRRVQQGEGVLQEVIAPPRFRLPKLFGLEEYGPMILNLGIFVLDGRFAGVTARLTPDLILREKSPEWLVPVLAE